MGETNESVRVALIRFAIIATTAFIVYLLTGCASTPPPQVLTVERAVTIPGPAVFLPVPPAMFDGCSAPGAMGPTNGDLLLHDHAESIYADCLLGRLNAIKALK